MLQIGFRLKKILPLLPCGHTPTNVQSPYQAKLSRCLFTSTAESLRSEISPEQLAATLDEHALMDDRTDISEWVDLSG